MCSKSKNLKFLYSVLFTNFSLEDVGVSFVGTKYCYMGAFLNATFTRKFCNFVSCQCFSSKMVDERSIFRTLSNI